MGLMTNNPSGAQEIEEVVVAYGPHPQQNAIVTFPVAGSLPAPLVLLFHGGFWRERWDREHLRGPAAELSAQGYVVANIEYRRVGGDGGWPNTLIDAATATDTLPGLISDLRPASFDPDSVVTVGHSAGGHLAVWTALRSLIPQDAPGWVPAPPRLAGAIALAGAIDLTEADRLGEGNGAVAEFLGGSPADVPTRYAAADPALIGAPPVPVVLIHGEKDDVLHVEMSRAYATRFGAQMVEISGGSHMDVIDPESTAWPPLLKALSELTNRSR
jgi:acetyl esterase/lipase